MRLLLAVALLSSSLALAQRGVPQNGYPTWAERTTHVYVNRSRADPTGETKACTSNTVRPPLVWNYNLNRSARFHSTHMGKSGQFMHNSPCVLATDIATTFSPGTTCDGSLSCSCSTGVVTCNTYMNNDGGCPAGTSTAWNSRIGMFGTSPSAENIAWGYSSPTAVHTGWMNSSGHCTNILGASGQLGVGNATGNYWTENFASGGTLTGSLFVGSHDPQLSGGTVAFRVNYYNLDGGPQEALLNLDGTCSAMTLERGAQTNGTWVNSQTVSGTTCRRYVFTFKDPGGTVVTLPETGSYGVGSASCADYATTAPAACSVSGNLPPTIATAPAASPSPVTATTTSLTVLGADDSGEAALTYTWSATGPVAPTFSLNGTNAAKATTATFTRAGAYVFTVTVRDAAGATVSGTVNVTVNQTPTALTVSPATASIATSATQQFTATVRDQFAQTITGAVVGWSVSGGGSISTGGLFTATASGGPFTVTATSGSLTATAQVTVTNAAPTIATAAAATPSPVTAQTTALSVLGADDGSEGALTYTWAATGPATVNYSANGTNAAKATTATFTRAGSYVFTVTARDAAGLTATSTVTVTVQQTASSLALSPLSATLAPSGTQQFTASVLDQFAQPMTATATWSVTGGGTVSTGGLFTAGTTPGGPFTLTATVGALTATAQVSVTAGNAPTIATAAAASPSTVTGTTTALSALGADDGGEGALSYAWSSTGPAAVSFTASGSNAAKASTATFTRAGTYQLTVTITDAQGLTVTSTVTVTVSATPTAVAVTPSTATLAPTSTQAFSAVVSDQFGTALSTQPATTWTVSGGGTISTSGLFTAGSTAGGPFTVTASASSLTGTAQVTVSAGSAPTIATVASATPSPVTGTSTALSVLGADDLGEAALSYAWTSTGPATVTFSSNGSNGAKSATATFTRAGSYTLTVTVTDASGLSVTSTVTVTVTPTLTALSVSPASTSVLPGQAATFTATGTDQFGDALSVTPTWSVSGGGGISAAGVFTAGASAGGPFTITATVGAKTATAQVTVTSTPPPALTVQLVSPSAGVDVTGTVTLAASTSDDARVANLEFLVDGTLLQADTTAPWSVTWDTSAASLGAHVLSARVTDGQGAVTTSADVMVNVVRPSGGDTTAPVVALTSPSGTVTGPALLRATATDDVGVVEVVFELDGAEVARLSAEPWAHDVPASALTTGAHLVRVTARDAAGNAASAEGSFEVPASTPEPTPLTPETVVGSCGCSGLDASLAALALVLLRRRRARVPR